VDAGAGGGACLDTYNLCIQLAQDSLQDCLFTNGEDCQGVEAVMVEKCAAAFWHGCADGG
jgi:hypothetical protein